MAFTQEETAQCGDGHVRRGCRRRDERRLPTPPRKLARRARCQGGQRSPIVDGVLALRFAPASLAPYLARLLLPARRRTTLHVLIRSRLHFNLPQSVLCSPSYELFLSMLLAPPCLFHSRIDVDSHSKSKRERNRPQSEQWRVSVVLLSLALTFALAALAMMLALHTACGCCLISTSACEICNPCPNACPAIGPPSSCRKLSLLAD